MIKIKKTNKSLLGIKINGNICLPEENLKIFDAEFAKFLDTLNARFDGKKQLTHIEPETNIPDVEISSLNLSTRIKNALHFHNIYTLKELSKYYEEEIRDFENLGDNSYAELIAEVEKHGIHIVSCMEETQELKKTFTKKERAKLYRNGIATIEDVCQLSADDIMKILGYKPFSFLRLLKSNC